MNQTSLIAACSSIIAVAVIKKRRKRYDRIKRRYAARSHKWLLRRVSGLDLTSIFMNELRLEDPNAFQKFVGMSYASFAELLEKVAPLIAKQNTEMREAISATARLLLTLRCLTTGAKFTDVAYGFQISVSSICVIIPETVAAIHSVLKDDFFKVPQSADEWKKVADEFEENWNFPLCLGAVDGKHIAIRRKEYGSYSYNYMGFHSIIMLGIVDANYNFLNVHVESNVGTNDIEVYTASSLCHGIKNNTFNFPEDTQLPGGENKVPFVFVVDDALPLSSRTLRSYGESSTNSRKIFNYRLSRAHRVAENAFGILANKYQILQKEIELSVEKVEKIILAVCALHNFIRAREGFDKHLCDMENTKALNIKTGSWRSEVFLTGLQKLDNNSHSGVDGRNVRGAYSKYFNSNGTVSWQNEAITKFDF